MNSKGIGCTPPDGKKKVKKRKIELEQDFKELRLISPNVYKRQKTQFCSGMATSGLESLHQRSFSVAQDSSYQQENKDISEQKDGDGITNTPCWKCICPNEYSMTRMAKPSFADNISHSEWFLA